MPEIAIYCADIGSIARNRFGWAGMRACAATRTPTGPVATGTSIERLADEVANDLAQGSRVALGLECPLFVPFPSDPRLLTSARQGEGNRAWCAGAGAGSLATGLTEALWLLKAIRKRVEPSVPAYLSWAEFQSADRGLFLWEAFVSGHPERLEHEKAASMAVEAFQNALPDLKLDEPVFCKCEVHSLIGAALLRTRWSTDLNILSMPCVVVKTKPNDELLCSSLGSSS